MLIIGRRIGEEITIQINDNRADDIHIMVVGQNRDQTRIGFHLPKKYGVWRNELLRKDGVTQSRFS